MRLIEKISGFVEGARGNWLHPSYGPFPDFVGVYEEDGLEFVSAVWAVNYYWFSAVIGDNTDKFHGGHMMTMRWDRDGKLLNASPSKGLIYTFKLERGSILRQIAAGAVKIYTREKFPDPWDWEVPWNK